MPTLSATVDAFVAAREYDNATLGRLAFWVEELGDKELAEITTDEVDAALIRLAERGRLKAARNRTTARTGQPLKPATFNRYVGQLGAVYRYARRLRLLPRAFVPPTRGIEKMHEETHHERYLRPEEVERLVKVARVLDRRWGRLVALIVLGFHTGLRIGNLMALTWRDVDLETRTVSVARTKNGRPMVSALTDRAVEELAKLPGKEADALVFEGKAGRPYGVRTLWRNVCKEAGLPGRNIHQLRHGCGSALANAGVNQAQIMAVMGHRTLSASARYMHQSTDDKRQVVDKVFG